MNLSDILNRLKELKYEPDSREIIVTSGSLKTISQYIKVLEKQLDEVTKERNSYFQQLNNELSKKPYIKFDVSV